MTPPIRSHHCPGQWRGYVGAVGSFGICLGLSLLACQDDGIVGPQPASVVVASPVDTLLIRGRSVPFSATVTDAQGMRLTGVGITWSSSAPAVASVDVSGLVTGVGVGSVTITATVGMGAVNGHLRVRVAASNLSEVNDLLGDGLQMRLVEQLTSTKRASMQAVVDECSVAADDGNVVKIISCLELANAEVASTSDTVDRVLLGIVVLYFDAIERSLAL